MMILTIDNVVSKKLADEIEKYALSQEPKWELDHHTIDPKFNVKSENSVEFIQFRSIIKHFKDVLNQKAYRYVQEIMTNAVNKSGVFGEDPFRAKLNILPKYEKTKDLRFNTPHVDAAIDHYVFLYYVNDSDGDTFLFEETSDRHRMEEAWKFKDFKIKERVSPKKNRLLIFDGKYYHTSSHPINNDIRCVINIDVDKKNVKKI